MRCPVRSVLRTNLGRRFRVNRLLVNPLQNGSHPVGQVRVLQLEQQSRIVGGYGSGALFPEIVKVFASPHGMAHSISKKSPTSRATYTDPGITNTAAPRTQHRITNYETRKSSSGPRWGRGPLPESSEFAHRGPSQHSMIQARLDAPPLRG